MGSREREQSPARHQPHLSSLVVRPSESGGAGSDYEPGEVRRDPPPYSRSDRYPEAPPGHGKRAASVSPIRHRKVNHHYRDDFDGPNHARRFRGGRGPGRFRDLSPPYDRDMGVRRFSGRGFDGSRFDHDGPFVNRNNPNVVPREGDWICHEPTCGNLNFARRDFCNNCNRPRTRPGDSPINFLGPPPLPRIAGPVIDRSPDRGINGYRSPPRAWGRDDPKNFGPPHPRHGGRLLDNPRRRERPDYREMEDYRDRGRFDRALPPLEWSPRDRGRDNFYERRGYNVKGDRRPLTPMSMQPLPPPAALTPRGLWGRDIRERSRSPVRSGLLAKDRHRDTFIDRGRDGRWGVGRDRFDTRPY